MNDKVSDYAKKMYIKLEPAEIEIAENALDNMESDFKEIIVNFPEINTLRVMTHTIEIDDVILRDDNPIESPEISELFKNASHVNGREIEVPKVVG